MQGSVLAPSSASDSYGAAVNPVLAPSSAFDSYGAAQGSVLAPSGASDSYGAAQGPVLAPSLPLTASSADGAGADSYGTALAPIISSEAVVIENDDVRSVQNSDEITIIQSTLQQVEFIKHILSKNVIISLGIEIGSKNMECPPGFLLKSDG